MITASTDIWKRYRVPNTDIVLYDVGTEDLGKPYKDGIDNDGDGAVDEGIDEGIDEMIDESRDDFIDNDGDWTLADDVGLNGDESGGLSAGVLDNMPTSDLVLAFLENLILIRQTYLSLTKWGLHQYKFQLEDGT